MNEDIVKGLIRPLSPERFFLLVGLGGICIAVGGGAGVVAATFAWDGVAHPLVLMTVGAIILAFGIWMMLLALIKPALSLRYVAPILGAALFVPPPAITLSQFAIGNVGSAAIFYVVVPIFAYYLMSPGGAWLLVAIVAALYGGVYAFQEGYPLPVLNWLAVVVGVASTCYVFGRLIRSSVEEAERATQLRRFLAPAVADALLTGDHDSVLTPHRREIAVFFADLRGFTNFAARAEPEDVLGVLNEYYETVGAVLHRYGATIGDYIGDGIMAYLNDPLPVPNPASTAIQMATEARDALLPVAAQWSRFGYDISFGIGVAYGHATLGVVGFSERHSYAPLGTVVNLAARLCSAASKGEVLVDRRAAAYMPEGWQAVADQVALKGLGDEVTVYRVPTAVVSDAGK